MTCSGNAGRGAFPWDLPFSTGSYRSYAKESHSTAVSCCRNIGTGHNAMSMSAGLTRWYDVHDWGIEGQGWPRSDRIYQRLPGHAEIIVSDDVWRLGQYSTGMFAEFETDSTQISARWVLSTDHLAELHMPATAVSGLDLYGLDAQDNWRWVGAGRPETWPEAEVRLVYGLDGARRCYRLYLPLFNGIESLHVGVHSNASFSPRPPRATPPVVVYGTSIVQGIAASRPGMCYTSILGRHLNCPLVNLGFSGRAKMESALATLLAEIQASAYVIDCLPNMEPELVQERAESFVMALLRSRPNTPIVLVEDRSYANAWAVQALRQRNTESRARLRRVYDDLVVSSPHLHYVDGADLLGEDGEDTVDGTHPTDLGFNHMAKRLLPVLSPLIGQQ